MALVVEVANRQQLLPVDETRLRQAVEQVLVRAGFHQAQISVAVVDDAAIRPLNRQFLAHDYATDVLSFRLDDAGPLEGEIVVSAETAIATAARFDFLPADELLLYVIHGALHLVGHDDHSPDDLAEMRRQEAWHLAQFGLVHRYDRER